MSASPLNISTELNAQDAGRVMRGMIAESRAVGKSLGASVKFTGWAVADALRTATEIAPKKRKITEVKGKRTKNGNKTFEVERLSKGKKSTFLVYAKNKREANKLPQVRIALRGLAAKSWHWAQGKLGRKGGAFKVSAKAARQAKRYGEVEMNLRSDNPYVRITNKLDYAKLAFKSGGDQTLNNVMERAASRMAHIIAGQIARKMKAK